MSPVTVVRFGTRHHFGSVDCHTHSLANPVEGKDRLALMSANRHRLVSLTSGNQQRTLGLLQDPGQGPTMRIARLNSTFRS